MKRALETQLVIRTTTTESAAAQVSYETLQDLPRGTDLGTYSVQLAGYHVDRAFNDPNPGMGPIGSGLDAYALKNDYTKETIIVFRGSQEGRDWYDDANTLGTRQLGQAVQLGLLEYVKSNSTSKISFVGHSLGGALAQYATYIALKDGLLEKDQVSLYTFNALGAKAGIDEYLGGYDPAVMLGVRGAHYVNPEDVVSRLSQHIGPETYEVPDFYRSVDGFTTSHSGMQFDLEAIQSASKVTPNYIYADKLVSDTTGYSAELAILTAKNLYFLAENLFKKGASEEDLKTAQHQLREILDQADGFGQVLASAVLHLYANLVRFSDPYADVDAISLETSVKAVMGLLSTKLVELIGLENPVYVDTITALREASVKYGIDLSIPDDDLMPNPPLFASDFGGLLRATYDNDHVSGGAGEDIIWGLPGDDIIFGRVGNDQIYGGWDKDYIDGGAGDDILHGDDGNLTGYDDVVHGGAGNDTIYGDGGNDALYGDDGNDIISGDNGNDSLLGGDGDDTLDGGLGVDSLNGGNGNDIYRIFGDGDSILDVAGTDTVLSFVSFSIEPHACIENLTLADLSDAANGTGNDNDNVVTGNQIANILRGLRGSDIIVGAGNSDTLYGGSGNDVLYGDHSDWPTGNDTLFGDEGDDILFGDDGNDVLDGGTGTDHLVGGAGDDTYVLGSDNDTVVEKKWVGTDHIISLISRSLENYANVENLTLTGTGALNGYGNELDNVITGTSGNNIIDGGNGGHDTLIGGAGNDTYIVTSLELFEDTYKPELRIHFKQSTTTIIDTSGADTVKATVSVDLMQYQTVENLTLQGGDLMGAGNKLANIIIGTSGNNLLFGDAGNDTLEGGAGNDWLVGGTGIDILRGGSGNDTYVLTADNDLVVDTGGNDTIRSAVSRSLAGHASIENITLTGSAAINATGNIYNNEIIGNHASNILVGGNGNDVIWDAELTVYSNVSSDKDRLCGGQGNDTLISLGGNDVFVFDTALNAKTNVDHIRGVTSGGYDKLDFYHYDMSIELENSIFTKLGKTGKMNANFFCANADGLAKDANDYIIYETDTGKLFYDSNGSAAGGKTLFAIVDGHPQLSAADFFII